MTTKSKILPLLCICFASFFTSAFGDKTLVIGIKEAPPFVFKDKGELKGITIDLWNAINAKEEFTTKKLTLEELLVQIKEDSIQTGLGAISITQDRETYLNFSTPYYESGLAIATILNSDPLFYYLQVVKKIVGALIPWIFLLFIVGLFIWLVERKKNEDQFDKPIKEGMVAGIWWACVTMTTVGYGDKTPKSFIGRLAAIIWMFSGIILISSLTATITTSLTVDRLQSSVQSIADLEKRKTGVARGTSAVEFMEERGLGKIEFESLEMGMDALNAGEIHAFVHDKPIMKHVISKEFAGSIEVLNLPLNKELYAFPINENNRALLEKLNRKIVEMIESGEMSKIINKYLLK